MATHAQLLQQLANTSHTNTYGWSAIAVFDGAVINPMLSHHYAALLHGYKAARPISAERLDFSDSSDNYATLNRIVLGAPRFTIPAAANMQNSVLTLTYDLVSGGYSERNRQVGGAAKVTSFINVGLAHRYTFSMDVRVDDLEGSVDANGNVYLTLDLRAAHNPQCHLSTHELANTMVAQVLLDTILDRQAGPHVLALGTLRSERGFNLPSSFKVKTQAKPGSTTGEGALVAFIVGPGGQPGTIPRDNQLPYLIPDDLDGSGRRYSATLLVSPGYKHLYEGDHDYLFGQLLFPNERFFQRSSFHGDTRDIAVFGRLEYNAGATAQKAIRRNAPGVSAQIVTVGVGTSPVQVTASQTIANGWTWTLMDPSLGTLAAQGATATFTPPTTAAPGSTVLAQRIIATNPTAGEHLEVFVVIEANQPRVGLSEILLEAVWPRATHYLTQHYNPGVPFAELWKVLGAGDVNYGAYTAALHSPTDIDIVICEYAFIDANGPILGYDYCIVQLEKAQPEAHWGDDVSIKLIPDYRGARPLSNGLQQFALRVTVDTNAGRSPATDAEMASLRLVSAAGGTDIFQIPYTLEGLSSQPDGTVPLWGVKEQSNSYIKAGLGTQRSEAPTALREKLFWVHTTSTQGNLRLAARFERETDGKPFTSNDNGGSDEDERVLTIQPQLVPNNFQYPPTRSRVRGGFQSQPPAHWTSDNPNNDWNLDTTDNFIIKITNPLMENLKITRIQWQDNGPGVKWESQQLDEDMFSYIGMAYRAPETPTPQWLEYSDQLYSPALFVDKRNDPYTDRPPHSRIASNFNAGELLLALIRTNQVFYRRRVPLPGFELEDKTFTLRLWDDYGNRHQIEIGFDANNRHNIRIVG